MKRPPDELSEAEIAERMTRGLRKSLTMAPKPHKAMTKGKPKAASKRPVKPKSVG